LFPFVMLRLHRVLAAALLILIASSASAAIAIDANVSKDLAIKSTAMTTPVFSTTASNELLLAFISTDYMSGTNTTVTGVTGAGLTWALVVRTNAQSGTSEIWRTFAPAPLTNVSVTATTSQSVVASMTVMSFTGVDTSGANGSGAIGAIGSGNASSGAPAATLMTTRANSLIFGVGNVASLSGMTARRAFSVGLRQSTRPPGASTTKRLSSRASRVRSSGINRLMRTTTGPDRAEKWRIRPAGRQRT